MNKILTVDIGNTNIATTLWNGDTPTPLASFTTNQSATCNELKHSFESVLKSANINKTELITGSVVSCVVPGIVSAAKEALTLVIGTEPIVISSELNVGINFDSYDKKSLGADRIADIVGAVMLYKAPVIICDLGTCTTISAVDSEKKFIGGMICPGVQTSLDCLHSRVPHLPVIKAKETNLIIGNDTASSLLTGAVVGTAAMISEMASKLSGTKGMNNCTLILTGGNASFILPQINTKIKTVYEPDLIMKGLREIYTNFC